MFNKLYILLISTIGSINPLFSQTVSDECLNANDLVLDANHFVSVTFNTNGLTPSANPPTCQVNPPDGWYRLNMPFDGNILITGSANTEYAVYDGCGGNELSCTRLGNHTFNLLSGDTYYVRVWRINGTSGNTMINVTATPTITNDECHTSLALAFDVNHYSGGNVLNTNGATISADPISCQSYPRDGWYSFNMPFDGNVLITGSSNTEYAIYEGCGGNQVFCNREANHAFNLSMGLTYFLRAYKVNGVDGSLTFNVQLTAFISNDECADGIQLIFDANNNSFNTLNTNGATISVGNPSCHTNPRDGWYEFNSPIQGSYQIDGGANTEFAIYDGCGGNQIACFTNGGSFDVDLNVDYWIRAWRTNGTFGAMSVDLLGTETTLPVMLSRFSGMMKGTDNILEWATQSEVNTNYFSVEKSLDLKSWKSIGMVEAIGNTFTTTKYQYVESGIHESVYYRLKIVDLDGYFEYSDIIIVERDQVNDWNIFPNPVRDLLYFSGLKETAVVKIYGYGGQCINSMKVDQEYLNLSDLKAGMYIMEIQTDNKIERKPLVKIN